MDYRNYPYVKFSTIRTVDQAEQLQAARVADAKWLYEKYRDSLEQRLCPICNGDRFIAQEPFHGTFGVDLCLTCQTPFVNPAPSQHALHDFYTNGKSNKLLNEFYLARSRQPEGSFILDVRAKELCRLIHQFSPDQTVKILEVGCNQGSFLSSIKKSIKEKLPQYNVELLGIDIDQAAIAMNTDPEITLIHGWAESLGDRFDWHEQFDIIVHFELIEHLIDPARFMRSLLNLMKPGAFMQLTTPNLEGLEIKASDYNSYRLMTHTIAPPLHLNSFSTVNFLHFAVRNGFYISKIETPGKLDVDCTNLYCQRAPTSDSIFEYVQTLNDDTKGWLQALLAHLNASSSMMVVLRKPNG